MRNCNTLLHSAQSPQQSIISSCQQRRNLRQERRENQLKHDCQIRDRRRHQRLQRQQQHEQPIMAANAANPPKLAAALQALAQAIQNIQQVQQANHQPLLDPYTSDIPFDLSSQVGAQAFTNACNILDDTWDGTADAFPTFIVALRVRAREVNWGAQAPQGILNYGNTNLLTDYIPSLKIN